MMSNEPKKSKAIIIYAYVIAFVLISSTLFVYTQTIDDIVGSVPSERTTTSDVANIYGVDTLPGIRGFVNDLVATANVSGDVNIKWSGVVENGLAYKLYRNSRPIINSRILEESFLVGTLDVADSLSTDYSINDIPDTDGAYYYAVVAELNSVAKFYTATAGVDMTVEPIYIVRVNNTFIAKDNLDTARSLGINANYVTSIKAVQQSPTNIMIYWNAIPGYIGNYVVYKNSVPISDKASLASSRVLGRPIDVFYSDLITDSTENVTLYYHVGIDTAEGIGTSFISNENYTADAIIMTPTKLLENIQESKLLETQVNNLEALEDNGNITLKWSVDGVLPTDYHYILITSTNKFAREDNAMNNSGIIGVRRINSGSTSSLENGFQYIDKPLPVFHMYKPLYYALSLVSDGSLVEMNLKKGMFTGYSVRIDEPIKKAPVAVRKIIPDNNIIKNDDFEKLLRESAASNGLIIIPLQKMKEDNNTQVVAPVSNKNETIVVEPVVVETTPKQPVIIEEIVEVEVVKEKKTINVNDLYGKAVVEFRNRKYSKAVSLLVIISDEKATKELNYQINLLLGRSYYKLGEKKNALDTFRKVYNYSPSEINFWISQVLSDL